MDEAVTWWISATPYQREAFLGAICAEYVNEDLWYVSPGQELIPLPRTGQVVDQVVDQKAPAPEPAPVKDVPIPESALSLWLDEDDRRDMRNACDTQRELGCCVRETLSCSDGAALAAICRSWLLLVREAFGKSSAFDR